MTTQFCLGMRHVHIPVRPRASGLLQGKASLPLSIPQRTHRHQAQPRRIRRAVLVQAGFVPRPVAKAALVAVAGSIALSLVQKVLSLAFFVLVAGGAAYLWLKSKASQGGSAQEEEDGDERLAEARRIMNKYK